MREFPVVMGKVQLTRVRILDGLLLSCLLPFTVYTILSIGLDYVCMHMPWDLLGDSNVAHLIITLIKASSCGLGLPAKLGQTNLDFES